MMNPTGRLCLDRIEAAAAAIDPVFLGTPQFVCEPLGETLGVRLALKIETMNPIRSFKGRGADWLVGQADPALPLVCASAGNFGQAMAYACRTRGLPLTVYAAEGANPLKVDRMRALGAEVILRGEDFDGAKGYARAAAGERGARFVEDSADIETVEGAGTMGLEWLAFPERIEALLIPLGNGAMFNGIATVIRERRPGTRLVAVAAAGAPAMVESWRSGRLITHERIATIADGIGVRRPVPAALADMRGLVDEAILVSEGQIVEAMRLLHRHAGVVAEPSGAVGVAALLEEPGRFAGQTVGTIVCGGNLTVGQMEAWL